MIVEMKKVTIIVSNKSKEAFLLLLRKAGIVHVKNVNIPSSDQLVAIEEEKNELKKVIKILSRYRFAKQKHIDSELDEVEILKKVEEIIDINTNLKQINKDIKETKNNLDFYKPWGEFNIDDLKDLKKRDINVNLYKLNKDEFNKIKKRIDIQIVSRLNSFYYIVGIFKDTSNILEYNEIQLPEESYNDLKVKLNLLNKERKIKEGFLKEQSVFEKDLERLLEQKAKKHKFLDIYFGMQEEEGLSILSGYCPVDEIDKIVKLARESNFAYLIEDPINEIETPTLIRNPKWINIISPVFKFMNTIPGYNEFDISFVFLLFFSLFFAMLIGDAGYGLVFLLVTWLCRKKLTKIPKEPFILIYVLSFSTIFWGAITGTWFGAEQVTKVPYLSSIIINNINSYSDNSEFMIFLCFIIGVIHLSIAHLMKCIRIINSFKALAQIGWIAIVWSLFFIAGKLIVNRQLPLITPYLLITGICLVLFFANLQKNIIKGILITLTDLPLTIISSFSDVVSYLRLFAVGYASVIVASNFNNMALSLGFGSIISGISAALILILGHILNITLGVMAVIVHGIRLNMLEFSGHLNMQWSGKEYRPFIE